MPDATTPTVLILTGPPGSGKTTVTAILAASFERGVHLESDRFFESIASGYVEPWKPEADEQNRLVMRLVGDAAAGYATAGYLTIVDGIIIPGWFFEPLRDALRAQGVAVSCAVLRPPLSTCIERAGQRASEDSSDPAVIERLWSSFADLGQLEKHVIDNAAQDAGSTARDISDQLRRGLLTSP